MICAEFFESDEKFIGFSISGHACYSEKGSDIVCASVSSAVELTINLITDGFLIPAEIDVDVNAIKCTVYQSDNNSHCLINMLNIHLGFISEEFPKTIKITTTEV